MYSSDLDLITKAQLEQQRHAYGFVAPVSQAQGEGLAARLGRVLAQLAERLPQPQRRHVAGG